MGPVSGWSFPLKISQLMKLSWFTTSRSITACPGNEFSLTVSLYKKIKNKVNSCVVLVSRKSKCQEKLTLSQTSPAFYVSAFQVF